MLQHSQMISKIKPCASKYNWKGIKQPSEKNDQEKCDKNNPKLLLMFYISKKWIYILPTFQSTTQIAKNKSFFCWFQIEEWHHLAAKKLSALLRGTATKHNGDFYCLYCLHSFRTKNKLESHKKCVKIKTFTVLQCLLKKLRY